MGSFDPFIFQNIDKVIYRLPPSFPNTIQAANNPNTFFSISINAVFDFAVLAEVYFKNQKEPLIINRYITLSPV